MEGNGLTVWDMVMPLFMFMAGVALPFVFSKYLRQGEGYGKIYKRIFRRVIVLRILSSLTFGATVMTGVFAGEILRGSLNKAKKWKTLFGIGALMLAAGYLRSIQMLINKRIWTSSMVLVTSGYCFWLMGLFYYIIDYKNYRKGQTWLKIIGMNSIIAYVLSAEVHVFDFSCLGKSVFFGLQQYLGEKFYPFSC